jgi:hypothetical protein
MEYYFIEEISGYETSEDNNLFAVNPYITNKLTKNDEILASFFDG